MTPITSFHRARFSTDRVVDGHYVTLDVNRSEAACYGLNIADVHEIVQSAIGGMNVGQSVEGLERYPINLRYPRDLRESLMDLRQLTIVTPGGAEIPLSAVAGTSVDSGPGADIMRRIAAPMVGGMISVTVLSLLVIPMVYTLWKRTALRQEFT